MTGGAVTGSTAAEYLAAARRCARMMHVSLKAARNCEISPDDKAMREITDICRASLNLLAEA